ncbi:MAG: ABC transporter permease [Planctomycetes bacterium]|nr:ABC transporter permease [Planctomycetota bacterium]
MYKLILTVRYLFSKWIAVFSVLSVWLCVAMVLIVFSVMDGFLDNIKQHSRGLLSDIIIDNDTLQGFPYYEEFGEFLKDRMPGEIAVVSPVIYSYGILREPVTNFTKPVRIVAIDFDSYRAVNDFSDSLYYNRYYPGTTSLTQTQVPVAGIDGYDRPILPPSHELAYQQYLKDRDESNETSEDFSEPGFRSPHGIGWFKQRFNTPRMDGEPLPGIIMGTDVIYSKDKEGFYRRFLERGCEIILTVLPLTHRGTIAENPIPVAMRNVDDSRTKVYEIDKICVYVDFKLFQRFLSMGSLERVDGTFTPPRASQLLVRLTDDQGYKAAQPRIEELWVEFRESLLDRLTLSDAELIEGVSVETWETRQQDFIQAVEKEKVLVTILFAIISLVAIVLIGVVFYMIVIQKTRDIGIIKSLGATSAGVATIFLMYGAVIGVIGGVLGVLTGSFVVANINELQALLARLNPNLQVWSPEVYTFDRIPSAVKPGVMVSVFCMAVATSIFGAIVPAMKAAWVWPVETLRYE